MMQNDVALLKECIRSIIFEAVASSASFDSKKVSQQLSSMLKNIATIDHVDEFDISFRTKSGYLPVDIKKKIDVLLSDSGWYFTDTGQKDFSGKRVLYTLHPSTTRKVSMPQYVYHVTPVDNIENVMRNGLEPRSSVDGGEAQGRHNTLYGPRVFVTKKPMLSMQLGLRGRAVALLKIDVAKSGISALYEDPEFMHADPKQWTSAYTFDSIPSSAIEVVKTTKHRGMNVSVQ